jgi:hypothetical protein
MPSRRVKKTDGISNAPTSNVNVTTSDVNAPTSDVNVTTSVAPTSDVNVTIIHAPTSDVNVTASVAPTTVSPTSDVVTVEKPIAKKRSRKPKQAVEIHVTEVVVATEIEVVVATETEVVVATETEVVVATEAVEATTEATTEADAVEANKPALETGTTPTKKRGRKPKGGKLIQNLTNDNVAVSMVPNIILHLKCGAADIAPSASNQNFKEGDVVSFNVMDNKGTDLHDLYHSEMLTPEAMTALKHGNALVGNNAYNYLNDAGSDDDCDENGNNTTKNIMKKLNHLKISFHMSDLYQTVGAAPRRSCCFWDTCEFDTPPVYLPKCVSNTGGGYVVYGCFCSPECALAYLMNERIDTSVKFERCQMLNAMYGKVIVSIKPAPNPHYTLSKFYGNLSIQEYRMLFKSEQIVYVVSKPLTHILPEIYEENNDFMLNNKSIPTNNYKPKKKTSAFG